MSGRTFVIRTCFSAFASTPPTFHKEISTNETTSIHKHSSTNLVAYSTKKSAGHADNSNPKGVLQKDAKASGKQSNQEQFTGRGTKTVRPATSGGAGKRYSDIDRELGTRLQMAPNSKGTADLKDPLGSYRVKLYAPVKNPDPQSRSGVNKAPGRRSPNSGPTTGKL
jgi:hypothetical protein